MLGETCPACITLPSATAALSLVRGEPKGVVETVGCTLFRAALIAGGLYTVGERQRVWRNALAGAVAVELFVVGWVALQNRAAT